MLLKEARERAELTREELARRSGVSARQIYNIETGRQVPRRATRIVLAFAVKTRAVDIDWPAAMKEAA